MSAETMLLLVLGAVAVIVAVRWVADRTGLPAAALLTLVGIGYALLPGPNVTLDPRPGAHPGHPAAALQRGAGLLADRRSAATCAPWSASRCCSCWSRRW